MRTIDFSLSIGFPLDQDALDFMQSEYKDIQSFLKDFLQVPNTGSFILSGLIESPSETFTAGWVCIDGELIHVSAGTGTKIDVSTVNTTVTYEDSVDRTPFTYKSATIDASTGDDISGFTRISKFGQATSSILGLVKLATLSEVQAGTDSEKAITPSTASGIFKGIPASIPVGNLETGWETLAGGNQLYYYKDQLSWVKFITAQVKNSSGSSKVAGSKILTLGAHDLSTHIRVEDEWVFECPVRAVSNNLNAGSPRSVAVTVEQNGDVKILDAVANGYYIDLHSITFPAD